MLSDNEIQGLLDSGKLTITPFDAACLHGASYDLHLQGPVGRLRGTTDGGLPVPAMDRSKVLLPAVFSADCLLACTQETLTLGPELVGILYNTSTLMRRFLLQQTSMIDPGFSGKITLELLPCLAIRLEEGMVIAKLTITRLRKPAEQPYAGKYQGAIGPQLAKSD